MDLGEEGRKSNKMTKQVPKNLMGRLGGEREKLVTNFEFELMNVAC